MRNNADGKQLAKVQKKLKRAEKKIAKATERLSGKAASWCDCWLISRPNIFLAPEIESELEHFQNQSQQHTTDLEELRNQQSEISRILNRQEKSVEKYLLKRSLLLQKKNECTSNIRDLGVLPEEAFEKYTKMSMEKVNIYTQGWMIHEHSTDGNSIL